MRACVCDDDIQLKDKRCTQIDRERGGREEEINSLYAHASVC